MKKSIGIDLGTTNSVVAFKDTNVKIIRNSEGEELTRSCVAKRNQEFVVGKWAYNNLKSDEVNSILSVKRLMGGAIGDPMVQQMVKSDFYKYGITTLNSGTENAVAVVLGGMQFTPEQISAEILKKLKNDFEKVNGEVTHAVITVPAYFTEKQRNATRIAAQLAGLKVQKLLPEPTAAAIAYGVDNLGDGETRTVLVYDFGGGTFDLSILVIAGDQFVEAGTGGDRWLGGDDIDKKLQDFVGKKVCTQYNISNLDRLVNALPEKKKLTFRFELKSQTELAKIQLSETRSAFVQIDNLLEDENGDYVDINVEIQREDLNHIALPFVKRSIDLIETLMQETGYTMDMIDDILLVGGTSCIPLVREELSKKFGVEKIKYSEKAMLAVAEGAAILSHRLGDGYEAANDSGSEVGGIVSTINHNYYLEIVDGDVKKYDLIFEKQTPLPETKSKVYKTTANNQKLIKIELSAKVEDGKFDRQFIGYYLIDENLPIQTEVVFDFYMDLNENISIKVYPKGRIEKSKKIILGYGSTDDKALKVIDELIEKGSREFRTVSGEDEFMKFVGDVIRQIDLNGIDNMDENKWWEVYYKTTEKFEQIKSSEEGSSEIDHLLYKGRRLLMEFGDIVLPVDQTHISALINELEANEMADEQLVDKLREKIKAYGLLVDAIQIELFSSRILQIPVVSVGNSDKQADVIRLNKLWEDAKLRFKSKNISEGKALVEEAYNIIGKYNDWL